MRSVELHFSWPLASIECGLLFFSALASYVPGGSVAGLAAAESALMLVPLTLPIREDKMASAALAGYAAAWSALAILGRVSPVVLVPAVAVGLRSAARLSYRTGSAIHRLLNLFLSLPPGRYSARRSKFGEAYAANGMVVGAVVSCAVGAIRVLWPFMPAGAVFAFVSVYLAALRDDGARSFEAELPFLMILSSFYSSAGHRGVEAALESISNAPARVFKGLGLARLEFLREKLFSSPTPGQTLERFTARRKDKTLAQIVDGYRTVSATGGDVYAYLVEQTDRSLSRFEETRLSRVRTTRGIAEVLLLTLALAPSVALTISLIGFSGSSTLYLLSIALPVASLFALALVDLYLPPVKDQIQISWGLPSGLACGASMLFLLKAFSSVSLSITAAAVALLVPLSVQYQLETNAARRDEGESLKMITFLVEALRIGKGVHEALNEVSDNGLAPPFARLVMGFNSKISLGLPPPEAGARVETKSWVTKASFVIIGHAMVLGGGLEIVERFRTFLTKYVDSWTAVRREALWTAALAASLPFVTLGGVSVITSLQGSLASTSAQPGLFANLQVLPLQNVLLAFVEVSALAAVVSSKLSGLTIKATPVALATMAATLVSLVVYGLA